MNPIKSVGRILLATGLIGVILLAAAGEASARHRPPARRISTASKDFQQGVSPLAAFKLAAFKCRFLDRLGQVRFHNYVCSGGMILNEVLAAGADAPLPRDRRSWKNLAAPEQFSCKKDNKGDAANNYHCSYTLVNAKRCVSKYRFTLNQMASTRDTEITNDPTFDDNDALVVWYPVASKPVSTHCPKIATTTLFQSAVMAGGANTGGGSITGGSDTPLVAGGAAAVVAGAGLVLLTFRRRQRDRAA